MVEASVAGGGTAVGEERRRPLSAGRVAKPHMVWTQPGRPVKELRTRSAVVHFISSLPTPLMAIPRSAVPGLGQAEQYSFLLPFAWPELG